ncbi:hypothetical protein MHEI_22430 [Mycobacterium heidelbergense]|nr:AAA family ATPase [Mycobacterium heidelbergense]BBZ50526.1 hypothetical protein MHEI_22430 [Mycobacterium heidelbergense]
MSNVNSTAAALALAEDWCLGESGADEAAAAALGGRDAYAGTALAAERREVLDWAQARIGELIGLQSAKDRFAVWLGQHDAPHHRGVVASCSEHHMVFLGAPGTAKTTFARVVAEVLFGLGTITRPDLTKVSAHDIVAGSPSHSAARMKNVCGRARGGVLFLDEAYRLAPDTEDHCGGVEAIYTLLTCMAAYRDELVVILAGHARPMQDFLAVHAGLGVQFPFTATFTSYTPEDIVAIGRHLAGREQLLVEDAAWELLHAEAARLRSIPHGHGTLLDVAGNAHYAHDVIHTCQRARLRRLHKLAPHRRDLEHLLHTNPGVLHANTTDMQRALTATHPPVTT